MKRTFILLTWLFSSVICFSQNEQEIYSEIISEFVIKNKPSGLDYSTGITLIVLEKPKYLNIPGEFDYPRFKEQYSHLNPLTFKDFINKNQTVLHFDDIKLKNVNVVILGRDSIPDRTKLFAGYPNWIPSILEFSNIGFNEQMNQAMVYYGSSSGPGVGGGIFIIFEKNGKSWKYKKIIPAWAE
jgi:hypothetical protein